MPRSWTEFSIRRMMIVVALFAAYCAGWKSGSRIVIVRTPTSSTPLMSHAHRVVSVRVEDPKFYICPGQWVHVRDATTRELILSDAQVFAYGGTMSIVHDPTNTINVSLVVHGEEISSLQGCERLAIELAAPDAALIRRTARTAGQ